MDIRLPTVSSCIKTKPDLRKTVAGMAEDGSQNEAGQTSSNQGNTEAGADATKAHIEEEEEESYLDGMYLFLTWLEFNGNVWYSIRISRISNLVFRIILIRYSRHFS